MHAWPFVGVPATALAATGIELVLKMVEVGCFTMASTKRPAVVVLGPDWGGTLMQIWLPLPEEHEPVVHVPLTPFLVAAAQPAAWADEADWLYM